MTKREAQAAARIRRLRNAIGDTNSRQINVDDQIRAVLQAIGDKLALELHAKTR